MDGRGGLCILGLVAVVVLLAGCTSPSQPRPTTDLPPTTDPVSTTSGPSPPTVTIVDENGSVLGTVEVRVADNYLERYTGLSDTDSLGPNEGMLFVHGSEGDYAYVMRDMAFPIDIVFIGADRRITAIHHAEVESRPLTRYRGRAKWVLEVPYRWTTDHGVEVGDRVRIDR